METQREYVSRGPTNLRADALSLDLVRVCRDIVSPVRLTGPRSDYGVIRGANVLELVVITDPRTTMGELAAMMAEIETLGATVLVKAHRSAAGVMDGITLCRERA